jgi:high affinity Mn2+ porin
MRIPRAVPLLCVVAGLSGAAVANEPVAPAGADVARLLQSLQDRLSRLEARNAELERRLAEPVRVPVSVSARLEDVETEVLNLSRKPDPLERFDGVAVGASLIMVAQHAKGGAVSATELSARADVEVELPGGSIGQADGRIFAHFRAGDGDGVDGAATPPGTFATANATVFGNINSPVLMQAWYQLDVPVGVASGNMGRVELTAGKIDPFGFFDGNNIADDESEGFMNLAFVHNPLLDAGGDIGVGSHGASPGVRVAYVSDVNGGNNITAAVGVFGTASGADYLDTFTKPLTIAQLEYAGKTMPGLDGAYRIYAWNNGRAEDQINTGEEKHAGWGISLDQQIAAHTTLFARYGHSTRGNLSFDRAYTLGAQFDGGAWGREGDRLGLAYGALSTSSEYRAANMGSGSEKIYELFYAWQANDSLQLTPSLQYIDNPAGSGADDLKVWGLRAKLAY